MIPPPPFPFAFIGSIGGFELGLIMVVVLLLFGPKKIPEVARTLGRIMEELRKASAEFKSQVMSVTEETRETARDIQEDLTLPQTPSTDSGDSYQSMNPYEMDEYQKRLHQDPAETTPEGYGPGGPEPVADGSTPPAEGSTPAPDGASVPGPALVDLPGQTPPAPPPEASAGEAVQPENRNV